MNYFLDARHLPCPQPVREAKQMLKQMHSGETLTVWCKDDLSVVDFRGFCAILNYELTIITHPDFFELKIS